MLPECSGCGFAPEIDRGDGHGECPTCGRWAALACVLLVVGSTSGQVATQPVADPAKETDIKVGTLKDQAGDLLPEGARVRLGTSRFRGGEYIPASALSPDGTVLAIGSNRDMVHLMDPKTGKEIRRLNLNGKGLLSSPSRPTARRSPAWAMVRAIRLFNVNDGKLAWELQNPQPNDGKGSDEFPRHRLPILQRRQESWPPQRRLRPGQEFVFAWDVEAASSCTSIKSCRITASAWP